MTVGAPLLWMRTRASDDAISPVVSVIELHCDTSVIAPEAAFAITLRKVFGPPPSLQSVTAVADAWSTANKVDTAKASCVRRAADERFERELYMDFPLSCRPPAGNRDATPAVAPAIR